MNEEIIKTYSLEEELDFFDFEPDDYQILSDGSEGYFVVLFSNLDDENELLLKKIGYNKISDDFWWRKLEDSIQITDKKIIELKQQNFEKFKKLTIKKYDDKIQNLVLEIVKKREWVNRFLHGKINKLIFKPSLTEGSYVLLLCKVTYNPELFDKFCQYLLNYFSHGKSIKGYRKFNFSESSFIKILKVFRNMPVHDHFTEEPDFSHKKHDEYFKKIESLLGCPKVSFNNEFDHDCIKLQIKLLERCKKFLEEIEGKVENELCQTS